MHSRDFKIAEGRIQLTRELSTHTAVVGLVHASFEQLENRLYLLHEIEKNESKKHKLEARKKDYLLGRFASRAAMSLLITKEKLQEIYIGSGVFSFPIIEGESKGLALSITHCNDVGMALVYPQAHPMAIDLEAVELKRMKTIEGHLSMEEQRLIQKLNLPKVVGYTMAWTIKESLSKVLKTGLTLEFKLIGLESIVYKQDYYESTFINFGQYKTVSYCIGDYVCSIVLPRMTKPDLKDFEATIRLLENIQ